MTSFPPELRWVRRAPKGIEPADQQPRLGVLGGTFNPVTRAHLKLAETAAEQFALHEVTFMLPSRLPHRAPEEATLEQRLELLEAALAHHDRFSLAVCSQGLLLEMAEALAPHYPVETNVYFLVGSDAAERILRWAYPDPQRALAEMFARFELVVAGRAGRLAIPSDSALEKYRARIHLLRLPADCQAISASAVRERVRAGEPIQDLVPAGVAERIHQAGLYRG